jgi:transmembrane sensor
MSNVEAGNVVSANDIKARAAQWLERRVRENWSESDQIALDAWLGESLAHSVAYWRLNAAWSRAGRLAALRHSSPEPVAAEKRTALWSWLGRGAAALLVAAIVGAGVDKIFMRAGEHVYVTPVGGHQIVALGDGSKVELNTNTSLHVDGNAQSRTAWLDRGEAYFQVKHDAAHPFVVMIGSRRVTDLGTKFLVRREAGRIEVSVMEGRIWLDSADGKARAPAALLTQGDAAVAAGTSLSVTKQSAQSLTRALSWQHGMIVFDNATLADAVKEFNRYNSEKLEIADVAAGRMTIGATFPVNDVERFAKVAQDVLGVHAVKRGNEIVISR